MTSNWSYVLANFVFGIILIIGLLFIYVKTFSLISVHQLASPLGHLTFSSPHHYLSSQLKYSQIICLIYCLFVHFSSFVTIYARTSQLISTLQYFIYCNIYHDVTLRLKLSLVNWHALLHLISWVLFPRAVIFLVFSKTTKLGYDQKNTSIFRNDIYI